MQIVNIFLAILLFFSGLSCISNADPESLYQKGLLLQKENKTRAAYIYFARAAKKKPDEMKYQIAALKNAPDENAKLFHGKGAWEAGAKTRPVLLSIIRHTQHTRLDLKCRYAVSLYKELPDSLRTEEFLAELYSMHKEYDSSIAIWSRLEKNRPEIVQKRAEALIKKDLRDSALAVLENLRTQKALDGGGYILLARLNTINYNFAATDHLIEEMKKYGLYSNAVQLEYAGFLIAQKRHPEARKLLEDLEETASDHKESLQNFIARSMILYIDITEKNIDSIRNKFSFLQKTNSPDSAEIGLYGTVIAMMNDSATAKDFASATSKLPPNPLFHMVYARKCINEKSYKKAIAAFKNLPDYLAVSPEVVTDMAVAYSLNGDDKSAFRLISLMHAKGVQTKRSLATLRDLSFKNNLLQQGKKAQELLEKKYGSDIKVRWFQVIMAIQNGKPDKALRILDTLQNENPSENQFEVARLAAMFLKKEFSEIIERCNSINVPFESTAGLKAATYRKMGDSENAKNVYQKWITLSRNSEVLFEYINYLFFLEDTTRVIKTYQNFIAQNEEELLRSKKKYARILNNLSWIQIHAHPDQRNKALNNIKLAYKFDPENINIIDTYAEVLVKNNSYKKCIKLLSENVNTDKSASLQFYLALSFDKIGKINKAVRYYRSALENFNKKGNIPSGVSITTIRNRIEKLTQ